MICFPISPISISADCGPCVHFFVILFLPFLCFVRQECLCFETFVVDWFLLGDGTVETERVYPQRK